MQGSNILDGFSKKMIKEDHYLACTTKMFEIVLRLPGPDFSKLRRRLGSSRPRRTPALLNTHPRGYPTIHLSKSLVANAVGNLRYQHRDSRFQAGAPATGRRILSSFGLLSMQCR